LRHPRHPQASELSKGHAAGMIDARSASPRRCPICNSVPSRLGSTHGRYVDREFLLARCPECCLGFIENVVSDWDQIYSIEYYAGEGADPLVDYVGEMEYFDDTVRQYEWRGIFSLVSTLMKVSPHTRWLDYGCGTGGLVRYCREQGIENIVGSERGIGRVLSAAYDIPVVDEHQLESSGEKFDIVTAIEVLEHSPDPIGLLERIRTLLREGGLFFYTTGNAEPFRDRLLNWRYVVPEIHVSFFEPSTLDRALAESGFTPERIGFRRGHVDIIRFKVLKNLRVKRRSLVEKVVPWSVVARLVDEMRHITAHPVGWAR
jgi:SAM-dependent methyltransferase